MQNKYRFYFVALRNGCLQPYATESSAEHCSQDPRLKTICNGRKDWIVTARPSFINIHELKNIPLLSFRTLPPGKSAACVLKIFRCNFFTVPNQDVVPSRARKSINSKTSSWKIFHILDRNLIQELLNRGLIQQLFINTLIQNVKKVPAGISKIKLWFRHS